MMLTTYCDVFDFLTNAGANIETASLVGGNSILTGTVAVGAPTLPVSSVVGFPMTGNFSVWLFDGAQSERVTASVAGAALNVANGVQAVHAAGISVANAGSAGCLADTIARASRDIESFCHQGPDGCMDRSLFTASRTEVLRGPGLRAAWDGDYTLVLHPWRFPVQAVSAGAVQFGANASLALSLPLIGIAIRRTHD